MALLTKGTKTYINNWGYLYFIKWNRPVHCWVERKLLPGEVVHHCDGNKLNNEPNNLMVFSSQVEHTLYHLNNLFNYGDWYGESYNYNDFKNSINII
ncbi:MAG: HNH endonuclease [Candidatus Falkowbacteria bacterium]|nr:HNH endonuclease [Candidatus Falkowbacteria bacterium]